MTARRQHGFTLTELLVVVALVGVLATLGVSLLRGNPRPVDAAAQVSSKLAEASRKAVAAGAVRGDVAAALGSTARTRVRFAVTSAAVTLTLQRLVEDAAPAVTATWEDLSVATLPGSVVLAGYSPAADLAGGAASPAVALGTGDSLEVRFNPDGTADGLTVYLAATRGPHRARVVVLPLGGTPMTFDRW